MKKCLLALLLLCSMSAWSGPAEDAALREAAGNLDIIAVKTALKRGANPNTASSDPSPVPPLNAVGMGMLIDRSKDAANKAFEITKVLFENGAKLGNFDKNILFFPISQGNVQLVSLLLDRGASPIAKIEGYTPTELALKYSQKEIYDLLVSRGGIPVNKMDAAQLAFVESAGRGDIAGMQIALEAGALINGVDADGRTALINAVRWGIYDRGRAETVWWLLDAGADPNLKAESGFKELEGLPLHIFVAMNKYPFQGLTKRPESRVLAEETLSRLLRAGAMVSGMDSKRKTPLHVAAKVDNVRVAEILIREGARVMARDVEGRTPLDYAESAPMIALLKRHGATER